MTKWTKKQNNEWSVLTYNLYGTPTPIKNLAKQYTLLHSLGGQFCVAFRYDESDNTWGQGHYFSTFDSALEFMFKSEED